MEAHLRPPLPMLPSLAASLALALSAWTDPAGAAPAAGRAPSRPSEARPAPALDVLLVVLDDVASSDADVIETPTMDWLASRGVSFRRAYSMPFCNQTRYTLMFGEYRGTTNGDVCAPPQPNTPSSSLASLPKLMRAAGYATGLFGKWHVGSNDGGPWEEAPRAHGFDVWRAGVPENVVQCGGTTYWDWMRVDDGVVTRSAEYQTTAVVEAFRTWWESERGPRFAYVAFQGAHAPFHAPPAHLLPPGYPVPTTNREMFDAMVISCDTALGELLASVDLDTTLVLVVGDNGTPKQARRPDQAAGTVKGTTFEDGIRVPFVVSLPRARRGFESRALIHTVDVFATLADVVGADLAPDVAPDSVSFARSFIGPGVHARTYVYSELESKVTSGGRLRDRAVVSERFKLRRVGPFEELYDLYHDPREQHPLDPSEPRWAEIAERLARELR